MRIKISTICKIEFLLAIIVFIFMTIYFLTDNIMFIQIAATAALVNFVVSTIRCIAKHSVGDINVTKIGGEK